MTWHDWLPCWVAMGSSRAQSSAPESLIYAGMHTVVAALSGRHRALIQVCGRARPDVPPQAARSFTEVCIPCRSAFKCLLSWAGHTARKHGYRSHVFLCAQSATCLACGRQFSSIGRLRRHLTARAQCVNSSGSFTPAESPSAERQLDFTPQAMPQPLEGDCHVSGTSEIFSGT